MTTQFLSRVDREVNLAASSSAGPGSYQVPSSISTARPGFAPFASTSSKISSLPIYSVMLLTMFLYVERTAPGAGKNQVTPAPYQVPEEVFKVRICFSKKHSIDCRSVISFHFSLSVETSGHIRI
jgi:hypothetical protein